MARKRDHRRRRRRLSILGLLGLLALGALAWALAAGLAARELPTWIGSPDTFIRSPDAANPDDALDWRGRRGVYLTSGLAANRERLERYVDRLEDHGLNALVIDVKDSSSVVAYPSDVDLAAEIGARHVRFELSELVDWLHQRDVYLIARHVVFNDPKLAAHLNSPNAPWVSPTDERVLDYNLAIAREVAEAGVDEIQFDYIRYPDGGPYQPVYTDRYRAITEFLRRVNAAVGDDVHVSVDVFGRTLRDWNRRQVDPIGQSLEALMPHADALSPMVYPSHYEDERHWHDPYGTVHDETTLGLDRGLTLRPFLQAFDRHSPDGMDQSTYIAEQVRAVRDLGLDGYLFWNPQGDYADLWGALDEPLASVTKPND